MRHSIYRGLLHLPSVKGKAQVMQLYRAIFFTPKVSQVIHGLKMELDPIEWTQSDLMVRGSIEPLTSALYGKLLRHGDVYVDVGAHVGFHTLIARHFIGGT